MKKRKWTYWLFVRIPFWFVALSFAFVALYKVVPVYFTPLMVVRAVQGERSFEREWKPLGEISPEMVKAVIASEDGRFAQHHGFDWIELRKMMDEHKTKGKKIRGCSTISQQTAKNLFSTGSSTWTRKIWEAYWTFLIEKMWSKDRIMEVYLNIIEMGPGIYGVEAAAQKYYNRSASKLTREQAIAIAICLPNPLRMNPTKPTRYQLQRRATLLQQIK